MSGWVIAVAQGAPTGAPLAYDNLRALFPDTSFPVTPTTTTLAPFGYGAYVLTPAPTPGRYETVTAAAATFDPALDAWVETWTLTPMTPTEQQAVNSAAMDQLRLQRNGKLSACDWTQLPDVPLTPTQVTDWRTYRQQLRDYMGTVTDPFNPPAWPVPPS